jgi:hypothetical protein
MALFILGAQRYRLISKVPACSTLMARAGHWASDRGKNVFISLKSSNEQRHSGPRVQSERNGRQGNHQPRGGAATVAGGAGPGFHIWPSGHILQDTDSQPLIAELKDDANDNISFFVQKAELYGSLTSALHNKTPAL